jgi:hypothetical protein
MKIAATILLTLICFAANSVQAADRALLIGVGKYPNLRNLPGIQIDLNNMEQVALRLGFAQNQIKKITGPAANLSNVETLLSEWLVTDVKSTDRVFIYFSAHGVPVADMNNDEKDHVDEALAFYDSRVVGIEYRGKHKPQYIAKSDAADQKQTVINVLTDDRLGELIANIPSKNVYLFVDACHSHSVTRGGLNERDQYYVEKSFEYNDMPTGETDSKFTFKGNNYIALTAAQDDQKALATRTGSVFTTAIAHAVLNAPDINKVTPLTMLKAAQIAAGNIPKEELRFNPDFFGPNHDLLEKPMLGKTLAYSDSKFTNPSAQIQQWTSLNSDFEFRIKVDSDNDNSKQHQLQLLDGDKFGLSVFTANEAKLLLLNIDDNNNVEILYPSNSDELKSIKQTLSIAQGIMAQQPFGTDTIIGFALPSETDLTPFVGQSFALDGQDPKLYLLNKLLGDNRHCMASDWLQIVTKAKLKTL